MSLGQSRRGARLSAKRKTAGGGSAAFRTSARGNDEATGNNNTSVITVPGTVQNGDVMLVVAGQSTSSNTFSIAGGGSGVTWTTRQGPNTGSGTAHRAYLFSARATAGSAGSTITVTSTGSSRFPALLEVASGVTDTGILTAVTINSSAISSHVFPSVTVPSPGGFLLLGLASLRVGTATPPTLAGGAPAGSVLDDESNTAAPSSPNLTVSGLHATATVAAGSRTIGTATSAAATQSIVYTVALSPA